MERIRRAALTLALLAVSATAHAVAVPIVNHSFEDDANTFDEFFFGDPNGWSLIDPGGIIDGGLDVQGTLEVTGGNYFPTGGPGTGAAPHGDNVAILFIGTDVGTSEVGLGQVLTTGLAANTAYSLVVEVGNINSGTATNGSFFDLSGFPGYRIELLAGGVVLASASAGIDAAIAEGTFETVTLDFISDGGPAQLGEALEIRLFNLNLADPTFPGVDLEVDFDNVRLDASAVSVTAGVPEPASAMLLAVGLLPLLAVRRARA